jgi:hypothetical protein
MAWPGRCRQAWRGSYSRPSFHGLHGVAARARATLRSDVCGASSSSSLQCVCMSTSGLSFEAACKTSCVRAGKRKPPNHPLLRRLTGGRGTDKEGRRVGEGVCRPATAENRHSIPSPSNVAWERSESCSGSPPARPKALKVAWALLRIRLRAWITSGRAEEFFQQTICITSSIGNCGRLNSTPPLG